MGGCGHPYGLSIVTFICAKVAALSSACSAVLRPSLLCLVITYRNVINSVTFPQIPQSPLLGRAFLYTHSHTFGSGYTYGEYLYVIDVTVHHPVGFMAEVHLGEMSRFSLH